MTSMTSLKADGVGASAELKFAPELSSETADGAQTAPVSRSGATRRVASMMRGERPSYAGGVDSTIERAPVPQGAFKGTGPNVSGPDRNALLMWKDPEDSTRGFAIVAEYSRTVDLFGMRTFSRLWNTIMPERLKMTMDIPRIHLYSVQSQGEGRYSLTPLRGNTGTFDPPKEGKPVGELVLSGDGMKGATLTHPYGNGTETIRFDGSPVGSRLEPYVPGRYFDSARPQSGLDYFGKEANVTLSEDRVARYLVPGSDALMSFHIHEPVPGLMRMTFRGPDRKLTPEEKAFKADIESRGWFTLDIVCWKAGEKGSKGMTTNEVLGVNLEDPTDVRFLYERHDRPTDLGTAIRDGFVAPGINEALTRKQLPAPTTAGS